MKQEHYQCGITSNISAKETYQRIMRVTEWWSENIEGSFEKLNDVFTIHFAFGDSFVIKIVELVPDKKIVWQVMDCNLTWVKNSKEWKDTEIRFEILNDRNSTHINFAHIGLVPDFECYNGCANGWNQYIKKSLFRFLNDGHGEPDKLI
ncbi:MAG: SRPBCC domain-containing protein [Bacteriovoracaceae bacterium]